MTKQQLIEENRRLRERNKSLEFELDNIKRMLFGQSSERFIRESHPADQLSLFRSEAAVPDASDAEPATETIEVTKNQ